VYRCRMPAIWPSSTRCCWFRQFVPPHSTVHSGSVTVLTSTEFRGELRRAASSLSPEGFPPGPWSLRKRRRNYHGLIAVPHTSTERAESTARSDRTSLPCRSSADLSQRQRHQQPCARMRDMICGRRRIPGGRLRNPAKSATIFRMRIRKLHKIDIFQLVTSVMPRPGVEPGLPPAASHSQQLPQNTNILGAFGDCQLPRVEPLCQFVKPSASRKPNLSGD
jgi:hypothetical protein